MKKLKTFESFNNETPKIGDYVHVVLSDEYIKDYTYTHGGKKHCDEVKTFVDNNIGQIVKNTTQNPDPSEIAVMFDFENSDIAYNNPCSAQNIKYNSDDESEFILVQPIDINYSNSDEEKVMNQIKRWIRINKFNL